MRASITISALAALMIFSASAMAAGPPAQGLQPHAAVGGADVAAPGLGEGRRASGTGLAQVKPGESMRPQVRPRGSMGQRPQSQRLAPGGRKALPPDPDEQPYRCIREEGINSCTCLGAGDCAALAESGLCKSKLECADDVCECDW